MAKFKHVVVDGWVWIVIEYGEGKRIFLYRKGKVGDLIR